MGKDDESDMIQQALEEKSGLVESFMKLCRTLDSDHDGTLSHDEFVLLTKDPSMLAWASSLHLDVEDAEELFQMLSSHGNDEVDPESFVYGCIKVKGGARSIDLISLTYQ